MTSPEGGGSGQGGGAGLQYAVELYLPRLHAEGPSESFAQARSTAERIGRQGTRVRFLRSLFLPGDEICFLLFEGPSAAAVADMAQRAGIVFERVIEAELVPRGSRRHPGSQDGESQPEAGIG